MAELISAEAARKMASENGDTADIAVLIKKAAIKGFYNCSFFGEISTTQRINLEKAGYVVEYKGSFKFHLISWNDVKKK